jgi:hypothetical protein
MPRLADYILDHVASHGFTVTRRRRGEAIELTAERLDEIFSAEAPVDDELDAAVELSRQVRLRRPAFTWRAPDRSPAKPAARRVWETCPAQQ